MTDLYNPPNYTYNAYYSESIIVDNLSDLLINSKGDQPEEGDYLLVYISLPVSKRNYIYI